MRAPGQIAYFRVYPERRGGLYYRVRVFQTVAAMHRYLRACGRPPGRFCKGMCSSWRRYRGNRLQTDMGEVVFALRWLGAGLIAHEATHAALGWARRVHIDPMPSSARGRAVTPIEERFCYGHGEIVRQIACQLYARKLIT